MMWIPLRSAKMKRRILGFQRRVWCPKWTPAARRASRVGCESDIVSRVVDIVGERHRHCPTEMVRHRGATRFACRMNVRLTLRELEPLAGLRTTRLLALDRAGI